MPFQLVDTDCSPLVIDFGYEVTDKDLLANYVGELILGHHYHIAKILNTLAANLPSRTNDSIEKVIVKLRSADVEKRDGWLFQMISWLVLVKRNTGRKFYSNYPHFAPAQHGIDGLGVLLDSNDGLDRIIITEDKCTTGPRGIITQQVFPEFESFEKGEKDNAIIAIVATLLGQLDAGKILDQVQNDLFQPNLRSYRIGITREGIHNDSDGRKRLFRNYDKVIAGNPNERRSAASIHIDQLRVWMADFSDRVIKHLESKKTSDV